MDVRLKKRLSKSLAKETRPPCYKQLLNILRESLSAHPTVPEELTLREWLLMPTVGQGGHLPQVFWPIWSDLWNAPKPSPLGLTSFFGLILHLL